MANIEGVADHAAPEPVPARTVGWSPKSIAATVVGALVGIAVATLNAVQENPGLLGTLPAWVQGIVLAVVPPLISLLATVQASPGVVTPAE